MAIIEIQLDHSSRAQAIDLPAHVEASYPASHQEMRSISAFECAFESESSCESISIDHLLVAAPVGV